MAKHVLCILAHASTCINGIAFAESEDPKGMLSVDPVDDEIAANFTSIPGYEIHEVEATHTPVPTETQPPTAPADGEGAAGETPQDPAVESEQAPPDSAADVSETENADAPTDGEAQAAENATGAEQADDAEAAPPATPEAETAPAVEAENAAPSAKPESGKKKGGK